MPPGKTSTGNGAGPPKAHSPTPSSGPNTRGTTRNLTSTEEIEALPSNVMDTASAESYLKVKLLSHGGQAYTLSHLSSILFHITQMSANTPLPVITAIRAVAYILKKHTACEIAEAAANHFSTTLAPQLIDHVIMAITPQLTNLRSTSELLSATVHQAEETLNTTISEATNIHRSLKNEHTEQEENTRIAADRIEETANELHASVEECQKLLKTLSPSLDVTQERINQLSSQLLTHPMPTQNQPHTTNTTAPQPSYSSIAASHLPPMVEQAVGRAAIRARQILLDPQPGKTLFSADTSNSDIAKKLKDALSNIRTDDTPPGDIKAVLSLRNGGIIIELESERLASWMRDPTGRALFEAQFDTEVSFRKRTFALVLEYLPIQLQIEQEEFLRNVENENNLPDHSLATARWIKPPTRRTQQQRKAFALLQVIEAPIANDILRDGLCINNERIEVRKDKREPLRCAKCQRYGHIARNCSASSDICGTCSAKHRTSQCSAFRTTRCINCNSNDHTSWSRKCREFIRRCELMDEKYPENRMPFFPTETAWTHAIRPPHPSQLPPPPSTPSTPLPPQSCPKRLVNANLRQATIGFPRRPTPPPPQSRSDSDPLDDFQEQSIALLKEMYPNASAFGIGSREPAPLLGSPPNVSNSPSSTSGSPNPSDRQNSPYSVAADV